MERFVRSEIDFALKLLRQQDPSESFVFSPASIAFGLALIHSAAKGEARDEIRKALLNGATDKEFEKHFSGLTDALLGPKTGTEVNIANHVFCNASLDVRKPYLVAVKKLYNSEASQIDFSDGKGSANTVNNFVSENTKGHIKEIIKADDISPRDVAILINAIFFKAQWWRHIMFSKYDTRKREFFSSANKKREIYFMHNFTVRTGYNEDGIFKVLNMQYTDSSFSMSIFLPKTRFGLTKALRNLDSTTIQELLSNLSQPYINITIPKWKMEKALKLEQAFKDLGINKAFEPGSLPNLAKQAFLQKSAHMATIEVNEQGTVASAVTPSILGGGPPPKTIDFVADHPFLYMITKDLHPLFVGVHN